MPNPFSKHSGGLSSPASRILPVTPNDDNDGSFAILGPRARLAVLRKLAALTGSIEVTGRAAAIPGGTASAGARASAELGLSIGF